MRLLIRVFFLAWSVLLATASAEDLLPALPQPLTLQDALKLSSAQVPVLMSADADQQAAIAEQLAADALTGVSVTARGRLRAVEPSYKSLDRSANDSSAGIALRKRLYDFGYSDSLRQSAGHAVDGGQWRVKQARQQAHLAVMRAFFEVILADLDFARDNEAMAIAYIRADRARDRNELGQVSDVELLEAEADSEEARRLRFASESRQLLTRSRLAIAMGRPDDLVSNLVTPVIELPESDANDFHAFWEQVMRGNPELLALRARREAARAGLEAARNAHGPVLSAELEAAAYNRNTSSTHPLSAGLLLEVPLFTGGGRDAEIARARGELLASEADLRETVLRLRQQARELWARRGTLRADIRAFRTQADFRDLYLDRSRALYELEVKTDLGDAMTQTSEVRRRTAGALFGWAINQAQLEAMTGELLENQE